MKKSPSKTRRAGGAAGTLTCGSDRLEAWWLLLSRQVGEACDRFWAATPERREIEAKRKSNYDV
jgi:hypothetical protein